MGLTDKDKLSCPLLLHMIFLKLCTGFKLIKRKKRLYLLFFTLSNEKKDLLIEQIPFSYLFY